MRLADEAGKPIFGSDRHLLNAVNKYLPEGQPKYTSLDDIPPDVAEKALRARTEAKAIERVIREVKARNGTFYDIGSGDARVVEAVAKAGFTSVGIEIDPLKWLFSTARLKIRGVRNARILRTSFYKADLSGADIIFCYLPNKTLEKLEPRMKKLRGKTIICYRIKFPTMKPAKEFEKEKVYVYKT